MRVGKRLRRSLDPFGVLTGRDVILVQEERDLPRRAAAEDHRRDLAELTFLYDFDVGCGQVSNALSAAVQGDEVQRRASWLTGHGSADNAQDVNLFGLDATLIRTDPGGGYNNTLLQGELMYGDIDGDGDSNYALGAYVLGQQQFHKDLYFGVRLDWTENPLDDSQEAWGVTPYVSWYWSEFLRWRFSYQHRNLEDETENVFWLQATWIFGAHPAHPYWSMR